HLRVQVSSHSSDRFEIESQDTGEIVSLQQASHPLIQAARHTANHLNLELPSIRIVIASEIPIASGLGSGAAVTTAIVSLLYKYYGLATDYANINRIVYSIEKLHHGTPSGIDNTVIVYEKPVYYVKGQEPQLLTTAKPLYFVIANTGIAAATQKTVAAVREMYNSEADYVNAIMAEIRTLVDGIYTAIIAGDAATTGKLMTRNHQELKKLGVSVEKLDRLVDVAIDAGAYGAKLSGGGGGGNMIAITSPENQKVVQNALQDAGATQTFTSTLEPA
ncbi:MAG: mevalonate kinase, partial [Chloroflexota bacterium]